MANLIVECRGAQVLRKTILVFSAILAIGTWFFSVGADAQAPAKVYRIGWLSLFAAPSNLEGTNIGSFIHALRDLGYVEGRNLVVDARSAEGKSERLAGLAAELVALSPDAIVAVSTQVTNTVRQATATIPIIFVQVSDPVGYGFVNS